MSSCDECSQELSSTPLEIKDAASKAIIDLLPKKSIKINDGQYDKFMLWCSKNNVHNYTENVLLAYFQKESETLKCSTLWSHYSMLKSTLSVRENVDISNFKKLISFLKRKNDGYRPKKSKVFSRKDIENF